jgi:hypothetical protein
MSEICPREADAPQASSAANEQPAKLLVEWVGQLLEDVQGAQADRLRHLRSRLQCDAFTWDNALLTHSVEGLLAASRKLEFQPLRNCGLWARLTGATEAAAREFGKKYHEVLAAAARARQEFDMLSRDYRAHTSSARRLIVELDIEYRALDREIDRGAEWLVELSYAIGNVGKLCAVPARAMALSGELKRFRRVSTLAKEITLLGWNVLERRAALLETLKHDLHGFDRIWRQRVAHIATKTADGRVPLPVFEKAREVHSELVARLDLTSAACLALQMEEQAMARRLAMFRDLLDEEPAPSACQTAMRAANP